jgi:hypothetical protein
MFKFAFFFLIPFLSISTVGLTACQSSSPTALVTQSANPRSPQSSASPGLPSPTPTNTFSAGPHPFSASLFQDNTDLVKPCEEGQCLFQQAQKDQCSPQTQNLFGKGLTPLNPVISCYYMIWYQRKFPTFGFLSKK